ncbi:hypothetical protein HCB21_07860 [Listeria booriae]|uniref:Uncharacterized protein n=1 Tax=Listeria booriae TaxID=1552123 RepID=A0A7X1D5T3_9LIST|nr:hypothetical protein [Listeria booriae]MBC2159677.1 hypothetical protein [Listeria booriae]MBC2162018.1 hypothetical protein [Listeria booriae]MBC2167076.1 hypothetical protein [Listeria booriae]MBC2170158.1 hypothetical protein [Listeria booriae]MBC2172925.1 hypothetical protein [Listeria booriae]
MPQRTIPVTLLQHLAKENTLLHELEKRFIQEIDVLDEHELREVIGMFHRHGYIFLVYTNKDVICCITTKGRKLAQLSRKH